MTIQIRRRCRRCCLGRTVIYALILLATCSTALFLYTFDFHVLSDHLSERVKLFIIDETDLNDARIQPMRNVQLLHEDYFNTTNLACRYPKLMIDNPEIWKHLDPVKSSQPDCEKSTNWVYVDNGL